MNPKIQKLKAERATDIIGIVREYNIGIEELSEFVKRIKERSAASEEN